jgi:septation ring formation regulator EzrA
MTEQIEKSIEQILAKAKALHLDLESERSRNGALLLEIDKIKAELFTATEREFMLNTEIETLKSALHLAENKVVEVPVQSLGKREEEIEELVKEIEYCIEQLKK